MKLLGPALALSLVAVLVLPAAPLDALTFRRADANLDGSVNIADAVTIFSYLFSGGALPCVVAGDANDDEAVDIADAVAVLDSLFSATSPIPPPFPHCGPDPTPGALPCAVPGPCAEAPELVSASATAIRPGDLIELTGFNFDPDPLGNIVAFVGAGGDEIRGQVESVDVAGGAPPLAATLDVRVPSGVRTGTLELRLPGSPFPLEAGAIAVTAAPVLLGAAVGDDGTIVAVLRDALGNVVTDTIQLLGINLGSVASVTIFDGIQTHNALSVVPGLPASAQYDVPDGLEAITVELPQGLLPLGCTTSRLVFTAFGAGSPGPSSNPYEVPFALLDAFGTISEIPATFTGAILPAGVRSGDVEIAFQLLADPAGFRYDVQLEYLDPLNPGSGTYLPCTTAPGAFTGALLLPGTRIQISSNPAIVGPGVLHRVVWDSAADIGADDGTTVTRLRLRVTGSTPATSLACAGRFTSEWIVIDNGVATTSSILEEFTDISRRDPASTAVWATTPGALVPGTPAPPQPPAWGSGTVDVVLAAGASYAIDTTEGTASIVDVSVPGSPVDVLPAALNPGAAAGEFHVRSIAIEAGASLAFSGENPLVFRAAGDGSAAFVAASIAGTIDLDGANAVAGTDGSGGLGGAGGPCGGGDGGDGGWAAVDPNIQSVVALEEAESGALDGGRAGQSLTFLVFPSTSPSLPRGAGGGGGGHATSGQGAVNTYAITTNPTVPGGAGGRPHGDAAITRIRGGSGGGGGGAIAIRLTTAQSLAPKHGGGGGGGGGAFAVIARGSIEVLGTVTANGGNGSKGSSGNQPGAGGGGAGGAILFRATGDVVLGPGAQLSAAGGFGAITQTSTGGTHRGGNGAPGRIRVEANGALPSGDDLAAAASTPPATSGPFATAGREETFGLTLPYAVALDGVRRGDPAQFGAPELEFLAFPATTHAIALFEGADADPAAPARPGEFYGLVDDPALLDGAEFIRARIFLYRPAGGAPVRLDSFEVPFTLP